MLKKINSRSINDVLKSYAKINLTLKVIKKHKNGLHDIQSIYCLVNCFDKILINKIEKFKKDKVIFKVLTQCKKD